MKRKSISIIIPCLNSGETIENTLNSILKQTLISGIEIIIVDGGSVDSTFEVLNKYGSKIQLIKFGIKGVPGQICEGVKHAKGEYIGFVDSDDYIEPKMYEILLNNLLKTNSDISVCKIANSSIMNDYFIKNEKEVIQIDLKDPYISCRASRVNKLYKKEILLKTIEYYNSSVNNVLWEDTIFALLIYSLTNKIVDSNQYLYYYCKRANSYSRNPSYDISDIVKLNNLCNAYNNIHKKYKNPLYNRLFINPFQSIYILCLYTRVKKLFFIKRRKIYKMIRESYAFSEVYSKCLFDESTKYMAERQDVTFKDYQKFLEILNNYKYFKLDTLLFHHAIKKIKYKLIHH